MTKIEQFFKISIAKNKMMATIVQLNALNDDVIVTKESLIEFLNENEVLFGIDETKIEDIVVMVNEEKEITDPITIANGIAPSNGEDAYLVPVQFSSKREHSDNVQQVDLKKVIDIPAVTQEDLVGEKMAATEGAPGRTVTDEEVPPQPGKDFILRAGKNTRLSEDRMKVFAIVDGQVSVEKKVIHVYPVYEINGDIDMSVGNIDFVGNVNIRGSVPAGFSIKAKGDIRIHGTVEAATLESNGSIFVSQGIVAQGGGLIKAKQDLHTSFINQGNIVVDGDIHVTQGIMHSNCTAGGSVYCNEGRGNIVGGVTSAAKDIIAKEIGNSMHTATSLYVGTQKQILEKEKELENIIKEATDEIEKLNKLLQMYELKAQNGIALSTKERIMKLRVRSTLQLSNSKIEVSQEELKELREQLEDSEKGSVIVEGAIHPNADVNFGKYRRKISSKHQFTKITLVDSEIKVLTL
ncbi:FapA family protein [Bacillus sp. FJAT-45350]|uniref:FapA family protein n=1 Tax=Bacillus sp. FJAT-45350 TaxID=2011014 RepID=UPI000BB8F99D|nr:FapA family protein [Bacillus sp. FJAT-45350]